VIATPVVADATSVVLELVAAEDMGVDVVATPAVVDGTSVVLVVAEGMGVDVMLTPVVADDASTVLELVLAEGMGVEVVATPVVVNDISLVVLDLVVTEGMGVDVTATPVVVDGSSVALVVAEGMDVDVVATPVVVDTTGTDKTSASGRPAFKNCALIFSTFNLLATDAAALASFAATSTSILIPSARRCRLPVFCALMLVILTMPTATTAAFAMLCLKVSCFALSNSAMEIFSPTTILTKTSVVDGASGGKTSDGGSWISSWHGPPSGPVHPALHVQAVKVALVLAELELSGQASHAVKAGLEYLPASHSMQSSEEELPSVDKYVPAEQF